MLVSCDDFGMLFFRSINQYRQFFTHLPREERFKFHRHSTRHSRLRMIAGRAQTASAILLRIE